MEETTASQSPDFESLLEQLFLLNYNQSAEIMKIEQQIYAKMQINPNNIEGLITMMFEQNMLGNRSKSKALANKIWDIGGNISPYFEQIYIENLLNLGLVEMASILLKPRFEKLKENADEFYPVLAKFSVMTGNINLLERLSDIPEVYDDDELLFQFADVFRIGVYQEQFKNIQKLILENSADYLCSYEYNLYDDRGFPELEIELYVNFDDNFCSKIEDSLNAKIEAFWISSGRKPLRNISVVVKNIKTHESWYGEED